MSLTPDLTISYPSQCCTGSCIESIGLHNVTRAHAETVADHLAALLGQHVEAAKREAWDEGREAERKWQAAEELASARRYPMPPKPTNPYRAGAVGGGGGAE